MRPRRYEGVGRGKVGEASQHTDKPAELLEHLPAGKRFQFACHDAVRCFTDCCRDLHLLLTPYDVLRAKGALGMDSSAFLDRFTVQEADPTWKIPVVRLKMNDNPSRACPFVTKKGCRIYLDRPGACRAYPLGRAARPLSVPCSPSSVEEEHFLVRESHCFGFQEGRQWTAEEWVKDQGLAVYNEMNDLWMEFLSRYKPGSRQDLSSGHWKMFYMACYSLDRFREFVFRTRFLSLFDLSDERQEKIRRSDQELLRFAYTWLAFSLFGDPVLTLRDNSIDNAGP